MGCKARFSHALVSWCLFLCCISFDIFAQSAPENSTDAYIFTKADVTFLKRFSIENLPSVPPAPSNRVADNTGAAELGHTLFFDKGLSRNRKISCAHCHRPDHFFSDPVALSSALGVTRRSTPSLLGSAWSPWQYWDGRKDSLWSQALEPLEHPEEMGLSRSDVVRHVLRQHRNQYTDVFGPVENPRLKRIPRKASPHGDARAQKRWARMSSEKQEAINTVFANVGKALMAYQRRLPIVENRFDQFLAQLKPGIDQREQSHLSTKELRGLRLFVGKANCASCHNGPLLTNFEFHNIGVPEANIERVDLGRYEGVRALSADEFSCLSEFSDAKKQDCEEMTFLKTEGPELVGAIKTPTLRNIADTAPYMQAGQFATLAQVISHYNAPKPPFYDREQHPNRPHFDILPLRLEDKEVDELEAFLKTLSGIAPRDNPWWAPPNR